MISLKSFNLARLLSQQVAPACLGRELQGSNVFLDFFGCVSHADSGPRRPEKPCRCKELTSARHAIYSSMITDGCGSTRSNNSTTSGFRIRMQPQLAGLPILASCFVP